MKKTIPIIKARNLGPVSSKALADAGIKTLEELQKMGWQKAIMHLVAVHPKFMNLNMYRALIGACLDVDWREVPKKELSEAKKLLETLK